MKREFIIPSSDQRTVPSSTVILLTMVFHYLFIRKNSRHIWRTKKMNSWKSTFLLKIKFLLERLVEFIGHFSHSDFRWKCSSNAMRWMTSKWINPPYTAKNLARKFRTIRNDLEWRKIFWEVKVKQQEEIQSILVNICVVLKLGCVDRVFFYSSLSSNQCSKLFDYSPSWWSSLECFHLIDYDLTGKV